MEETNNKQNGVSMFSVNSDIIENDPFEEIFALNIGDFLSEHLISEELAKKISAGNVDEIENLKKQLREITAIYSPDKTLSILGFDEGEEYILYNSIAKTIKEMSAVGACHIWLSKNDEIPVLAGTSVDMPSSCRKNLPEISRNKAFLNVLEENDLRIIDCENDPNFEPIGELDEDNAVFVLAVPVSNSYYRSGLFVLESYENKPFDEKLVTLVQTVIKLFAASMAFNSASVAVGELLESSDVSKKRLQHARAEITSLIADLGVLQQAFVENLAKTVDARSGEVSDYSEKVADLARKICTKLELNEKTKDLVFYAALLRNIGKITLPIELFNKKGKLTKEDWKTLYNHPNVGVSLLMSINFMAEVIPYIHYHTERWDGSGKEGLKGTGIPLGSRIIAVADAFCAMTSKRTYRDALSKNEALSALKSEANEKWDPMLVDILVDIVSEKK